MAETFRIYQTGGRGCYICKSYPGLMIQWVDTGRKDEEPAMVFIGCQKHMQELHAVIEKALVRAPHQLGVLLEEALSPEAERVEQAREIFGGEVEEEYEPIQDDLSDMFEERE